MAASFPLSAGSTANRLEDGDDDLGEPAPPDLVLRQAREWRGLEAVDANRHDHRVRLVGDEAGTVIDFHQAAGDRERPSGKMTRVSPAFTA